MRTHTHEALGQASWRGAPYSVLVIAAAVSLFVMCAEAKAQTSAKGTQAESSSGNAQNGKQLYTSYGCYECHGREGQGSKMSGPRLGPSPMAFSAFARYIRQPKGQMPPYTSKVVSDAELADIYAFLKSLPVPPAAKSIPLLN
jgi:mono/diheme cytochrome c family protein